MIQFLKVMSSNVKPLQTPITAMAAPGDAAQEKVLLYLPLTFKQALTESFEGGAMSERSAVAAPNSQVDHEKGNLQGPH